MRLVRVQQLLDAFKQVGLTSLDHGSHLTIIEQHAHHLPPLIAVDCGLLRVALLSRLSLEHSRTTRSRSLFVFRIDIRILRRVDEILLKQTDSWRGGEVVDGFN